MKQRVRWIILAVMTLVTGMLLYNAGRYLVVNDTPSKSDVIVVFSGDRGARMEKAVELYQQGYAPKILISGGEVYDGAIIAELMKDHAIRLGVPESAILLEKNADSTFQNAENTKVILLENRMKHVMVVTSDYHTRRTSWTLDMVYTPVGIKYSVISAESSGFNQDQWLTDNKSVMIILQEYIKLVGYHIGRGK